MSLTLVIIINMLADAALIALLAFVTSRASRLTAHADGARRTDVQTAAHPQDDQLAQAA